MAKPKTIGVDADLHAWIITLCKSTGETVHQCLRRVTHMPAGYKAPDEPVSLTRGRRPSGKKPSVHVSGEAPTDITQSELRAMLRKDIMRIIDEGNGSETTQIVHEKLTAIYKDKLDPRWFERYGKFSTRLNQMASWEFSAMRKEGLADSVAFGLWGLTDKGRAEILGQPLVTNAQGEQRV